MVRRGDISDIDFQFLDLVASDLGYAPFPNSVFPLTFVVKKEKQKGATLEMSLTCPLRLRAVKCRIDITTSKRIQQVGAIRVCKDFL